MAEPLGVTPPELRAASGHLHDVNSRIKQIQSSMRSKLEAEGSRWGDDRIGDQFAKGGSGYLAQLGWVNGSVDAKSGLLEHYEQRLKGTADSLEQQDQV